MKTSIWLDVDGVLLDYCSPFNKFSGLEDKGHNYNNITNYDYTKLFASSDECYGLMRKFAHSTEFENLPSIASVLDLEALKNMGYDVQVITQLDSEPRGKVARIKNLTRAFGNVFDMIHFTQRGECKLDYIRKHQQGESKIIVVEDNPATLFKVNSLVSAQLKEVGNTFIMGIGIIHPYNTEDLKKMEYIIPVPDFSTAVDMLLHGEAMKYESEPLVQTS